MSYKPLCSLDHIDIRNSINSVLPSWNSESYGDHPLCYATFVGGGYNRILLAFGSVLCGQMHLNVSTVSCLFRNRLEIGNTNASRAPLPAAWLCMCCSLFTLDFQGSYIKDAGNSGLIYCCRCFNCMLTAPNELLLIDTSYNDDPRAACCGILDYPSGVLHRPAIW